MNGKFLFHYNRNTTKYEHCVPIHNFHLNVNHRRCASQSLPRPDATQQQRKYSSSQSSHPEICHYSHPKTATGKQTNSTTITHDRVFDTRCIRLLELLVKAASNYFVCFWKFWWKGSFNFRLNLHSKQLLIYGVDLSVLKLLVSSILNIKALKEINLKVLNIKLIWSRVCS